MTEEVTCTTTTGGTLGGEATVCCHHFGDVYGGRMRYVAAPVALVMAVLYGLYAIFKYSRLKPFA